MGILRRSRERGKELPHQLKSALMLQAGLTSGEPQAITTGDAYHINQRNEGIDLNGVSGALMHTPTGVPAQAQRSGLRGKRSRSGISELSPSGGSEGYGACGDAQMQTFVTQPEKQYNIYENHGIDARYHLFVALMAYLMQNYRDSIRPLDMGNTLDYQMVQIHNYIFENFQTVTLRSLAKVFHYNEVYLSHLIRKSNGKTFTENLRTFRLARAEQLLRAMPNAKLSHVCEEVGYHDTVQCIRDFKAQYGTTPARYKREKAQEKSSEEDTL